MFKIVQVESTIKKLLVYFTLHDVYVDFGTLIFWYKGNQLGTNPWPPTNFKTNTNRLVSHL